MNRREYVIKALQHRETNAIPFDVPSENILAMAEIFRNQEKYLLKK